MLLTILSGISGSGKSSFARGLDRRTFSADDFFLKNGVYTFDVRKLSEAHGACFKSTIEALRIGNSDLVVDNTNTTSEEIAPYILAAQAFGYSAHIITFTKGEGSSTQDYITHCAKRNSHGVPFEGVKAQYDRLQSRRLMPWWHNEEVRSIFTV